MYHSSNIPAQVSAPENWAWLEDNAPDFETYDRLHKMYGFLIGKFKKNKLPASLRNRNYRDIKRIYNQGIQYLFSQYDDVPSFPVLN